MHRITKSLAALALLTFLVNPGVFAQDAQRPSLVLDENVWITFYDLPSRRFRAIRDAFVRRDLQSAARDLEVTIGFLGAEAGRTAAELAPAFADNIGRMERIRADLTAPGIAASDLDAVFAQAHWVLSQHYLIEAQGARDDARHRMAGRYLIATAHHLERAVLWSDEPVTRDVFNALESIRRMASRLAAGDDPQQIYPNRPLRLTAQTLRSVGEQIDRRVRIEPLLP